MKKLLFALLCVICGTAQPVITHLHDTIYGQDGSLYSGSVQISLSTPGITSLAYPVLRLVKTATITRGVFDVYLVPNDTASPALTSYVIAFGNGDTKTCTIPTIGTPITLANYCTDLAPTNPTPLLPLSWLNLSGYANGMYCWSVLSGVGSLTAAGCPGSGGSGGAAWGSITGTLSSQTDLQAALNAKEASITAGLTTQYWRGDKSWQTLNTAIVPESGNLYFTNARAVAAMSGLYESPLTFSLPLSRSGNTISCPTCGGSGAVSTVFGRTGAVVATSADYSFSLISGSVGSTQMPALTGDATTTAGTVATVLATVNSGPGSCGDATHVCQVTTNGKGLVTAQAAVSVTAGAAVGFCAMGNITGGSVVFDATTCPTGGAGIYTSFSATLSGNVTGSTFVHAAGGQGYTVQLTQGGSVFTFAAPANWIGSIAVSQSTGKSVNFSGTFDGTNLNVVAGSSNQGFSALPALSALACPPAGFTFMTFDPVNFVFTSETSFGLNPCLTPGTVGTTMVWPLTIAAVSHKWMQSLGLGGIFTLAQPAFADISGSVAATQMPALTGDLTTTAGTVATVLATVNSGSGTCGDATHVCQIVDNGKGLVTSQSAIAITGGGSGVTSIATTGPITGGTIIATGTIACPTCDTSAAALTNNAVVIGGGLQAASTISADIATTHALFATAGAPAFRALVSGDIPTSPTLVTPNIGAATGTSLVATGIVDGQAPVTVTTGASATLGGTYSSGYTFNEEATAATAVTYTLPTAAHGLQQCVANAYNGAAANTGALELLTSASGQFIIFTDGTLSATGGYVISAGAARDSACVVGIDSTHWMLYPSNGTWAKH